MLKLEKIISWKKIKENHQFIWLSIIILFVASFFCYWFFLKPEELPPIKVGIIHSLTGTMSIQEPSAVRAVKLAIDEINKHGGVLNRKVEAIIFDGQSDWPMFARGAEKLIVRDKVVALFGGWTSSARKEMLPIVEKHKHLLFYPLSYEGIEESPHIFYTGGAPNQQLLPGLWWAMNNLGDTFFYVGSDYIYPRVSQQILEKQVEALGGKLLGLAFLPLGSTRVKPIIEEIIRKKPKVILNNVVGDSNIAFFRSLRQEGITPEEIPNMLFSLTEAEVSAVGVEYLVNEYATWNYFQTIDTRKNNNFVKAFKAKYGQDQRISDPMAAAYAGVFFWANAVERAGTTEIEQVIFELHGLSQDAPEGVINIDEFNHHTWKLIRIGRVQEDGLFSIVWDSKKPVKPIVAPPFLTPLGWQKFIDKLYTQWGNKWEKTL